MQRDKTLIQNDCTACDEYQKARVSAYCPKHSIKDIVYSYLNQLNKTEEKIKKYPDLYSKYFDDIQNAYYFPEDNSYNKAMFVLNIASLIIMLEVSYTAKLLYI